MDPYDEAPAQAIHSYSLVGVRVVDLGRTTGLAAVSQDGPETFPVAVKSNTDLVRVTAVQVGTAEQGVSTSINVTLKPNPERYGGEDWHRVWNVDITTRTRSRNFPDDLTGRGASDGGPYESLNRLVSEVFDIISAASPYRSYDSISSMDLELSLESMA